MGSETLNYGTNGLNQVTAVGSTAVTSDGRGNLLSDGTNSYGTKDWITTYDEYGRSNGPFRYGYAGQVAIGSGLSFARNRVYALNLGRFLQTDPIGYGDGLNWYNYVRSDPINGIDPLGLALILITGHYDCQSDQVHVKGVGCVSVANLVLRAASGLDTNIFGGGGGEGSGAAPPTANSPDPKNAETCKMIDDNVEETKDSLPSYITDTWRWNREDALKNDLVTARMNLGDAEGVALVADGVAGAGVAASKSGGPVGLALGSTVAAAGALISNFVASDAISAYKNQITALKNRLLQLKSQTNGTCPKK